MIRKNNRIVAYVLAGAVMLMTAATDVSAASLPSAGAAVTLNTTEVQANGSTAVGVTEGADTDTSVEIKLSAGEASVDPMVASVQSDENGEVGSYATIVPSVDTRIAEIKDAEQFSNLVIANCNDYVNVRQEPSEEAEILGKLYNESVGEFISEAEGGWYQISSGSVTGYVKAEYVVTGDDAVAKAKEVGKRIATVNTTTLFVREDATTESSVVGMVPIEDELSVTEEEGMDGWVKVSIEEGEGYVSTDYVELSTEFVKAESKAEEEARLAREEAERRSANAAVSKSGKSSSGGSVSVSGSGAGASVASFACQFVGNPYVYGGTSLTNGADCSGFVMSVYANFGVGLPHSSGALRGCGYDVGGIGNAQPGDIVCYSGHVGIYIGGGQIVHASTAATGIKISNASYREILSVRRIF